MECLTFTRSIFGLKFEQISAPYKWVDDLQLYIVTDAATGEPLGLFYLDMFPREGKYNHFAEFTIIGRQTCCPTENINARLRRCCAIFRRRARTNRRS